MFDIKEVIKEAEAEVAAEGVKAAKEKLKAKLRQIAQARKIVANLELEYQALLQEIGSAG